MGFTKNGYVQDNFGPCCCLKRRPVHHIEHIKLKTPLDGWYAKKSCWSCRGTGQTRAVFGMKSVFHRRAEFRIIKRRNARKKMSA